MSAFSLAFRRFAASTLAVVFGATTFIASSQPAFSQGFLADVKVPPSSVPTPPRPTFERSIRLESLSVDAEIENSVAQVVVSQTFNNVGATTLEASFVFPIPYDGAVD